MNMLIKKVLPAFCFIIIFISCEKSNEFVIKGNISEAKNSVLYLEQVGIHKISVIDSVKLNQKGKFHFNEKRPKAPDFYRLRLNKQFIDIAVDSTETISIQANASGFNRNYTVEGSENCQKIKELSLQRISTAIELKRISDAFSMKEINQDEFIKQSHTAIEGYKSLAQKYILENPASTTAYYALLQTIDNLVIFDPYKKEDNRLYGAVATQWDFRYPDSERTKHIVNISLQGMKSLKSGNTSLNYSVKKTVEIFDINLKTISGKSIKLSEIVSGKITLLDFCSYQTPESPQHNILLAKIYEKYKEKGFQIYQISIDADEHAWKNAASNLPWMCVRDPESIYSQSLRMYNIDKIPTSFILDKEGEIVERIDSFDNLEQHIAKYLQ